LSRGMIACWNSHFRLLRHIATGSDDVAIVLEDDVDIEYNSHAILDGLWDALPVGWDIVFLGHCWSPHEDFFPPLPLPNATSSFESHPYRTDRIRYRLHPSLTPKCTHAYAVSRSGAARISDSTHHSQFTGPSFAYGRALDQAFVRLVQGRRISAFSIVPSIVVQTKKSPSDITGGNGSSWRDVLLDSTLA
ncbi:hypothetical protein DL93DRAFT_2047873, partial [Clavulina sp. PMI_390]